MYIRVLTHNLPPNRYLVFLSTNNNFKDIVNIDYEDLLKLTSNKKIKDYMMKHSLLYSRTFGDEEQRLVDKQIKILLKEHKEEL